MTPRWANRIDAYVDPGRAAPLDPLRSLRAAPGSLLLATGTAAIALDQRTTH